MISPVLEAGEKVFDLVALLPDVRQGAACHPCRDYREQAAD